jgi:hypothetical protein
MRRTPPAWLLIRLAVILVLGAGALGAPAMAQESTPVTQAARGLSRADPAPLGEAVLAGPAELRVREVLVGPEAVDAILAAAASNVAPRDGTTYVAVHLEARNVGEAPLWLDNDDFALTGDSGLVRRFLGAQPPDPVLDVVLDPGASASGWVAFSAPVEEGSLLLLFDSLELGGSWADRLLALQEGARIPDLSQRPAAANGVGTTFAAAASIGEAAVTDQWSVELLDVVAGAPAFDLVDYRTGALGVGDAALAYFPANAFTLSDDAGNPIPDVATLTPPRPDAAGGYYPGAVQEGWVMFDIPVDYATSVVRFLPFAHTATDLDPRYVSFNVG